MSEQHYALTDSEGVTVFDEALMLRNGDSFTFTSVLHNGIPVAGVSEVVVTRGDEEGVDG